MARPLVNPSILANSFKANMVPRDLVFRYQLSMVPTDVLLRSHKWFDIIGGCKEFMMFLFEEFFKIYFIGFTFLFFGYSWITSFFMCGGDAP